ncbi:MAG: hypothetical protein PWP58_1511 [Bacillota bacterium]|nr:hypothetical protein [Bacillota bacterium]MDK2785087.1 hypothetical protein [Bacillota bacterium]MDK2883175.1 hypothetical protein [Bacillota bacterium]
MGHSIPFFTRLPLCPRDRSRDFKKALRAVRTRGASAENFDKPLPRQLPEGRLDFGRTSPGSSGALTVSFCILRPQVISSPRTPPSPFFAPFRRAASPPSRVSSISPAAPSEWALGHPRAPLPSLDRREQACRSAQFGSDHRRDFLSDLSQQSRIFPFDHDAHQGFRA